MKKFENDVNGPQGCIQAVIGGNTKAEDVLIESEPEDEDDVIHVQQVWRVQEPVELPMVMWEEAKFLSV